jgi:hypothetical protein
MFVQLDDQPFGMPLSLLHCDGCNASVQGSFLMVLAKLPLEVITMRISTIERPRWRPIGDIQSCCDNAFSVDERMPYNEVKRASYRTVANSEKVIREQTWGNWMLQDEIQFQSAFLSSVHPKPCTYLMNISL